MALAAVPCAAHSDWTLGAEAGVRHDNNVGNAQLSPDQVADTTLDARLSIFRLFPLADGYSLTIGGDLGGEAYHKLTGLNDVSLEGVFALKKKWGLGAYAPWARAAATVARVSYDDSYRNAWDYRAILASGRRIDERWNLWAEYSYDSQDAKSLPPEVPGLSGDAYSQSSQNLTATVEFSVTESVFLSLGLLGRHGDVVSTTLEPNSMTYYASRALAADPAFGSYAYAYRLTGTTRGARAGISFSATAHSLFGCTFERLDTRAAGGNEYAKSVAEITWNYSF
jgi:hypothetical protein